MAPGVIVLKRLSDAQRDGDPIAAVIRASAVNHDGRSNGIMAPNGQAQRAVLEEAYRARRIEPGEVQYVEAHGTATRLGDPIEARALGEVLARGRVPGRICALGSVKTNIGHTEAAAGVAGVIKTALAMRHRLIPASLHFETPNPLIGFEVCRCSASSGRPLGVRGCAIDRRGERVRLRRNQRACGVGRGANEDPRPTPGAPYLLALSAKSPEALAAQVASWREWLAAHGADPGDLCYTAGARRSHHAWRIAVAGESREELAAKLGLAEIRRELAQSQPRTVFIFSGQGSHWAGMGQALYKNEPIFRASMSSATGTFTRSRAGVCWRRSGVPRRNRASAIPRWRSPRSSRFR